MTDTPDDTTPALPRVVTRIGPSRELVEAGAAAIWRMRHRGCACKCNPTRHDRDIAREALSAAATLMRHQLLNEASP